MVLIMLEKIKFTYDVAKNQDNLFTPNHTKFDCMIKYNGKQFSFPYQCNYHMNVNAKDAIYCLFMDAMGYEQNPDIDDFSSEFGYTSIKDAIRVYKACRRTYNALHRMFTDEELEQLYTEFEDY